MEEQSRVFADYLFKQADDMELVDADYETMATLGKLALEYRQRGKALIGDVKQPAP